MDVNARAAELLDALDRTVLLPPITAREPNFNLSAAYAVGAELAIRRRARGERQIGRKLGFTNRALWSVLGVDAPFWAPVYDTTVTFAPSLTSEVATSHLTQPRLEPELVLHFGSTPPPAATETELVAHIDWVALGYEIVQCHFPDWRFRTADAIADFGVHGALVVGPPCPVASLTDPVTVLRTFRIVLRQDGELQAHGGGANVLGSPLQALAVVTATAGEQPGWEPIQAGEIVTTGTLTGLHALHAGQVWSVDVMGMDLTGIALRIGRA